MAVSHRQSYMSQMLQDTLGKRFRRGIVLYTGTEGISFGKNLFALPIQPLWTKY